MSEISVALIASDPEQLQVFHQAVQAARMASVVASTDAIQPPSDIGFRRIVVMQPQVVLIAAPSQTMEDSLRVIESLRTELPHSTLIAVGDISKSDDIVRSVRAGAREFLDSNLDPAALLDAFRRLPSHPEGFQSLRRRGKTYVIIGAKGGTGTTTVAVNLALTLQERDQSALLDFGMLGHCMLHLNLQRPRYTAFDALSSSKRLDPALLESYLSTAANGLRILPGPTEPIVSTRARDAEDLPNLIDLLALTHRNVVIDLSNRLDPIARIACSLADRVLLVIQADVPSVWSAKSVRNFLGDKIEDDRFGIVVNRFKKVQGYGDSDIESALGLKVLCRIPDDSPDVTNAINHGVSVISKSSDMAESFQNLSAVLSGIVPEPTQKRSFRFFRNSAK
jgi:pilus assembly protein CpaE